MYYETKLKKEEGTLCYLVEALMFAEAEYATLKMSDSSDDDVVSVKRAKIDEILEGKEGEAWYKGTVERTYTNENGKTKKVRWYMLTKASTTDKASETLTEQLKQGYDDFTLVKCERTNYEPDILMYDGIKG